MDLEEALTGENLAFYKNIQDLKVLTAKAKALITRSHAMFNDIIQGDEFKRRLRATEQEEDLHSLKSLHGECPKCGLQHGAHDFCIVQEIIAVEKTHRESARKSATTLTSHYSAYKEDAEEVSCSQPTVSPPTPREKPPRENVKEWENLLYREMTPGELDAEYSKICYRYGVATGRKFLLARSLARETDVVRPLFTDENWCITHKNKYLEGKSKLASITRDCVTQKESGFPQPCPQFNQDIRSKMAKVLDLELPCEIKTPKREKLWKNALKAKPKNEAIMTDHRETIEDDYSSSSNADKSSTSCSGWCTCGLKDCDCGIQPKCNPPEKQCLAANDCHNNYLFTIREKLRKRALLKGKKLEYDRGAQSSSKEVSFDVVKKDSELMMRKAHALHEKDLKNCIVSAIGKDDVNLDKNVSKIAEITSAFTKPGDKAWYQWIEHFQAQDQMGDDEDISDDSDISTTRSNSIKSSSTTDRELQNPQPSVRHIPFVEEPLKLVDILFDKIYARFRKSVQKSSTAGVFFPYKRVFFSYADKLMSLKCTDSIGGEVFDKLNLHFHNLKSLKPKHLLKAQRLKRLKAKNKQLSRTIRRRNYVEGIQLGKHYRRSRKSIIFTKVRGYIGFNAEKRKLLQKPSPERFATCDLVGDESGVLLSKKRIHHHYRLLRTLFTGPMDSDDKESLMDEGMRERLQNFKKALHNSSQSRFGTESDTEDEGASMLKAASIPIRRPSKRDEKKLMTSAPGYFLCGTRTNQNSRMLSSRLNDYRNELSLSEETYPRTIKTSSCKTASKQIADHSLSNHLGVQSRALTSSGSSCNSSNRWGDYRNAPSLRRVSFPKTCTSSSRRLPSNQITDPTRCDQTKEPRKTFRKKSKVSEDSSKSHSFDQWEPFRLPTPPLSDSSCDEIDFDSIQHRFPRKEESHMEKSARIDARTGQKHTKENISNSLLHNCGKQNLQELDESELTDNSSDSYAPKLLKIPPKITSTSPGSLVTCAHDQRGTVYQKTIKGRATAPHLSDSSSTDTELVNPMRNIRRERPAWDHKSGLNRKIAPYLDTNAKEEEDDVPPSGRPASYESRRMRNPKHTFTSPLPKAGPSILKNSSLPKPPSDGTSENQPKAHVLGTSPVKRQSFSDSSYQTTSWPSGGLIRPACVVTERLLKATQGNPQVDLPTGSAKKPSAQSRATPEAIRSPSTNAGASKKMSVGAKLGVTNSGQLETEDDDSSPRRRLSVTIKTPKGASTSHHTGDKSPNEATVHAAESPPLQSTDSLTASPSNRFSVKRSSRIVSEVFRRRSLAPSEQSEKKEPHTKSKALKKAAADEKQSSLQNVSNSSIATKLKKLEAIGPTKKRCFNLDIGQGINCVNYLKENAPGADEIKKKELADLLVTPVEVKKAPKKATAKVENEISLSSTIAPAASQHSAEESSSSSTSLITANQSSKTTKIQAQTVHDVTPLRKNNFKTLDQIYKEVHGINKNNTPMKLVDRDYEYEAKKKQQLKKHKIFP